MSAHVLYIGGEDHALRLPFLRAMQDRGFRVSAAGSGSAEPFGKASIPFYPFEFSRRVSPVADVRSVRALARLLDELRPDLAQGYDTKPCLMLPIAARLSGGRTQTIRTICGRGRIYSPGSLVAVAVRPVYCTWHRLAAQSTAATVFEIDDDRRIFESHRMAGANGVVIPAGGGGVDVEGFEAALACSPSRAAMRESLGLASAEIVITVSRMTRQKGIPRLLEAADIVHRERPGVRFLLVGPRESEGSQAVSAQEIEARTPYVVATGPRLDVPALLRAADVFAFPTEFGEGVPRALLEAALAGAPIVATNMPGCRAVLGDGENGLLTPPRSPEKLAHAILDCLADPEAARARAARADESARRLYSLSAIADNHASLYASLLRGGGDSIGAPVSAQPTTAST
jgi:glycosyltransferase involved in cell wall biosynthesis